jgi:hypothetical protein
MNHDVPFPPAITSSARSGQIESRNIEAPLLPSLRTAIPQPGASPALRGERVVPYAVRNELRTPQLPTWLATLQKCAGVTLVSAAWLVFLWGMANLILAALHNQAGELGLGLDSTMAGGKSCLASFLLFAVGVPQWVMGERKLKAAA